MAKRVRFSPFVTYLGDEPDPPPDILEESLHMEGSLVFGSVKGSFTGGRGNRISPSAGRSNPRGSIDLSELFSCGALAMSDGSSETGFSFGSCELDVSGQSIMEGNNEYEDDDQDSKVGDNDLMGQFGDLDFSFGNQSDCSYPPLTQIISPAAESQPPGVDRCSSGDGNVAVGTAA